MKQIEVQLREGMARKGITGEAAEQIIRSIASFALYGFPESHSASFALIVYASAYLKAHYPAAFYTALLNNQPMGFYHPSTLVKDAQRHGVRFHPVDVQHSGWDCTIDADGAIRLGLRYVRGLRDEVGKKIGGTREGESLRSSPSDSVSPGNERGWGPARSKDSFSASRWGPASSKNTSSLLCPKCGCDDESMIERVDPARWFCNNCSHDWTLAAGGGLEERRSGRFASLDDLVARTGLRRDEVVTLADIGALNAFGYDRRSALWQAERAVRPSGELFEDAEDNADASPPSCPLKPMTEAERLVADYAGMGLTAGRHPMALRREDLAARGILRAIDLPSVRHGRRIRVAGMVITRQRPGTAKGFVFLTLEDETGIANIIVRPDLFARDRLPLVEEPFLIVDGVLQHQDGVTAVRAETVQGLSGPGLAFDAHDFY
jgi:error-prone DNA polymerase